MNKKYPKIFNIGKGSWFWKKSITAEAVVCVPAPSRFPNRWVLFIFWFSYCWRKYWCWLLPSFGGHCSFPPKAVGQNLRAPKVWDGLSIGILISIAESSFCLDISVKFQSDFHRYSEKRWTERVLQFLGLLVSFCKVKHVVKKRKTLCYISN